MGWRAAEATADYREKHGKEVIEFVRSADGRDKIPIIPVQDLIDRTFLVEPERDGTRHRAKIIKALEDNEEEAMAHPSMRRFLCSVNDGQREEIFEYNEIIQYLEELDDGDNATC